MEDPSTHLVSIAWEDNVRYYNESTTLLGYFDASDLTACTIRIIDVTDLTSLTTRVTDQACTEITGTKAIADAVDHEVWGYDFSGDALPSGSYLYEMKATNGTDKYFYGKFTLGGEPLLTLDNIYGLVEAVKLGVVAVVKNITSVQSGIAQLLALLNRKVRRGYT